MKKVVYSLLAVVMVLGLVMGGCTETPAPPTPTPPAPPAPAPTPTPPAPAPEVLEWRLQLMFPAGSPDHTFIQEEFCDNIEKASGGRLKITAFGGGTLVPVTEMMEAVGSGTLEMGFTIGAYHAGIIPSANLAFTIPYTSRELFEAYMINREVGIEGILREAYAEHNVHLITLSLLSYVDLWSKKPIRRAEDFKGLKVRASGITADVLAEAGAAPTFFPLNEIYGALERGVVDAAQWGGIQTNIDGGLHEVTKYVITPLQITNADLYVNMDAWNALPDDLKEVIVLAGDSLGITFPMHTEYPSVAAKRKIIDEYGMEVITLPEAEVAKMRQYTITVLDRYAEKDARSAEMVAALKAYLASR